MSNNVYGIDLGTNNFKVYSKATQCLRKTQ